MKPVSLVCRRLTPSRRGRSGFTLLEILLVLALIGLLAGALATGSARLLAQRPVTVEETFWEAVAEARKDALLHQREVRLRYDANERTFVAGLAAADRSFPLPPGETQLDFLVPVRKGAGLVLIGGILLETETIPYVTFYDDGTCTPFRVQIRTDGPARFLLIDPWTCAPVITEDK